MRLAIVGSGYVGLVSGACFADFGHRVICIDRDEARIAELTAGRMPIYEPGLAELVSVNVKAGRLAFASSMADAVAEADMVFLAVGTPSRRGDGHADLSHVYEAAREVAQHLNGFTLVVVKSTVPVGTGDEVENILREARPDVDVAVVSNPEFLREGAAIGDFKRPDRIVVGLEDERARALMHAVYRPISLNEPPLFFMTRRAAELTKYAANAFLAMKITFINEIADLCDSVGANVQDVARGIGLDGRIGSKFLHAGPGYGGSCFPKDTLALARTARDAGSPLRLVETTVDINTRRKATLAGRVATACGGSVAGLTVAVLGLAFKPNTDDMREAPSIDLVSSLVAAGATVVAFDPQAMNAAAGMMPDVRFADDAYAAADSADALVIVTEWDEFRALDLKRIAAGMRGRVLVDLRNIYRPDEMRRLGFAYTSVGRPQPAGQA